MEPRNQHKCSKGKKSTTNGPVETQKAKRLFQVPPVLLPSSVLQPLMAPPSCWTQWPVLSSQAWSSWAGSALASACCQLASCRSPAVSQWQLQGFGTEALNDKNVSSAIVTSLVCSWICLCLKGLCACSYFVYTLLCRVTSGAIHYLYLTITYCFLCVQRIYSGNLSAH